MILKFGERILTIKDVLPERDAFEYYFFYDSEEVILFTKKKEKEDGTPCGKFTRSN